jgi:hypothetical protein
MPRGECSRAKKGLYNTPHEHPPFDCHFIFSFVDGLGVFGDIRFVSVSERAYLALEL